MKERPILMSAPMVRAILRDEDPKTQTRRIVNVDTKRKDGCKLVSELLATMGVGEACPYGKVGDKLWVKETYWSCGQCGGLNFVATADKGVCCQHCDDIRRHSLKPSIFMKRIYSRLTLEIVAVRVERLHDITPSDAVAEGMTNNGAHDWQALENKFGLLPYMVAAYAELWEFINGPGSWALNPWVWVIEFRKLPKIGT